MDEQKSSDWFFGSIVFLILIFGLAIAIAAGIFRSPHYVSAANSCINNLRQIDSAAGEFALENHLTNGDHINFPNDLTPYIKLDRNGKIPSCPKEGFITQVK